MNRLAQALALCVSIALLSILACRAQSPAAQAPATNPPANTGGEAASPDAAPVEEPEVYLPASKSGGMFLR